MKHTRLLFLFVFASLFSSAQDSSRVFTHEIGFNTVSLIKQMISNNPTSTLPQLPYDVFYNLYYKDMVGLRIGVGINNTHNETDITGQQTPRTSDNNNLNYRIGASYNFVRTKRLAINGFADFVSSKSKITSSNTSTVQTFPNPIQQLTVESSDETSGLGAQFGVGVKYNLLKHLSIYAEVPFTYMSQKLTSIVTVNDSGTIDKTISTSKSTNMHITLPTTIYLVLRF